jgi:hypothetical protein
MSFMNLGTVLAVNFLNLGDGPAREFLQGWVGW